MYPVSTSEAARERLARIVAALLFLAGVAPAQQTGRAEGLQLPIEWRRIGNGAVDRSLAGPASGPVNRVWYSADGSRLFIRTLSGRTFETSDFESWQESDAVPPALDETPPAADRLPEPGAKLRRLPGKPASLYALGKAAYRSDDAGASWINLTVYKGISIVGAKLEDLAASPDNPDELVVAGWDGVFRSLDGGQSWDSLNGSLPNLPVRRLAALPIGGSGARIWVETAADGRLEELEWLPGERSAWRVASPQGPDRELELKQAFSQATGLNVTAFAIAAPYVYVGSADGWLWVSSDQGATWNKERAPSAARVESIFADPSEPRVALAALSAEHAGRILRTTNAGLVWQDLTANLPSGPAYGVTAHRDTGSIYVATDKGVFFTVGDLWNPGPATGWIAVRGTLPVAPVRDLKLDAGGNQLYAAVDGYGLYVAMAPHRLQELRVVSAADYHPRPAAPGSLLSVLGGRADSARAGSLTIPVLAASDFESQIQVPFEAAGQSLTLSLSGPSGVRTVNVPLRRASPALFVDRDGTPLLLDAESGVLLDAMTPARPGARVQILATGLGRVRPDWPTGLPAPVDNPPAVVAPVRVYLDGIPMEVLRASLAPGYIGFYTVEFKLPEIVNRGPASVYVEADGQRSNTVRIWLEP